MNKIDALKSLAVLAPLLAAMKRKTLKGEGLKQMKELEQVVALLELETIHGDDGSDSPDTGESLEELFRQLPAHLHVAHNPLASEGDRFRFLNTATSRYIAPGWPTVRALLRDGLKRIG